MRAKVRYFVETKPKATDTSNVREVESNATLTKHAIIHLRVRTALVESKNPPIGLAEHGLRSTAWVCHRRCRWLPTFLTPPVSIFSFAYLNSQ